MLLLMKPHISLPYSDDSTTYSLGISTTLNSMDQKLNVVDLEPGLHTVVSVTPSFIQTTENFDEMSAYKRKCKLPHETTRLKLFKNYSRTACEHECAFMNAVSLCKCIPWYYRNESSTVPICEMYGGYCFNKIMSTRDFYKTCSDECLEDCNGMQLSWEKSYRPINIEKICKKGSALFEFLKKSEKQHFSQDYYNRWKLAAEDYTQFEKIDKIMKDGNESNHYVIQCKQFVEQYISIVSVETPTNVMTLTEREVEASLYERVGVLGGEIGLFTGASIMSILDIASYIYNLIWPDEKESSDDKNTVKDKRKRPIRQNKDENDLYEKPSQTRLDQLEEKVNQKANLHEKIMDEQNRKIETLMYEMKKISIVRNFSLLFYNFVYTYSVL